LFEFCSAQHGRLPGAFPYGLTRRLSSAHRKGQEEQDLCQEDRSEQSEQKTSLFTIRFRQNRMDSGSTGLTDQPYLPDVGAV
jgi:hypothetical protein